MQAVILAIGTEIVMGELTDTNSQYIAEHLPAIGINLIRISSVADSVDSIESEMRNAFKTASVVFTIGGLGPTHDDLTREAIAKHMKEKPYIDNNLLTELKNNFKRRQIAMAMTNQKQALLIQSAQAIPNPMGTAPGWLVEKDNKMIIAIPGPPSELKAMWDNEVSPFLISLPKPESILTRTLKTFGIPEATVADKIGSLLASKNPEIGIYAKPDGVHIRMISRAKKQVVAQGYLSKLEGLIEENLQNNIWGYDDDSPESVLGKLLEQKAISVSTMESCTGGLLASTITDVSGSSNYYKGGAIAYSESSKVSYGVDQRIIEKYGVISSEIAQEMARASITHFGSDVAISVTGLTGPSGLEGKPLGTVFIGLATKQNCTTIERRYLGSRLTIKTRAVTEALLSCNKFIISS